MLNFQLSQSAAELLIFCPYPSHLANQIANNANQVRVREPFQRIRDARCHPKLESYFRGLDSPARKSAPVTAAGSQAMAPIAISDSGSARIGRLGRSFDQLRPRLYGRQHDVAPG